jgi:pre-rRNA-processing protein TSR1
MDVDGDATTMDMNPISTILATPTTDQDSLSPLADEDTDMIDDAKSPHSHRAQSQKGVRIDDHYYFADHEPELIKKKPTKGMSDYQAAWYISDSDESDHDETNEIEMEDVYENEPETSYYEDNQSEAGDTVTEMYVDLSPEEEARQYYLFSNNTNNRHELFKARAADAHFPDEVEYPPNVPARTQFARYRALKNFRSSPWDLDEPEDDRCPMEWSRLVRFGNWRGTCSRIEHESLSGGIKPGVRVEVYLRSCPREVLSHPPRAVYSLLKHENKFTTLNFTITPIPQDDEDDVPVIKSKDVIVVQYASRRYECRPIFSQPLPPSTENNLRKFERYLQPGRTSVASWLGKTVIGKDVPILFFKKTVDGSSSIMVC